MAAMETGLHHFVLQEENKTIDEAFGTVDYTIPRIATTLDVV